ncbi:MAG: ABC transporter ATP-binding protein [Lachnospiraceae bacterium]|nr:ABC transporter ATP-binding protein [Lachnospiraceae bacterium]
MIKAEKIVKKYKGKVALNNVSFEIGRNEAIAVVGPNGAGKSTLLRILSGINTPSSGSITREEGLRLGGVFDYNGLYPNMTGYENMQFFYRMNHTGDQEGEKKSIEELLEKLELLDDAGRYVKGYSKGMARKLAIARALLPNPDILLLDEPFDGLDIKSHAFLMDFLKDWVRIEKRSVIITSHSMADVEELCDRVLILKNGCVKNNSLMYDLNDRVATQYRFEFVNEADVKTGFEIIGKLHHGVTGLKYDGADSIVFSGSSMLMNKAFVELVKNGLEVKEAGPLYKRLEEVYLEIMEDQND